MTEFWISEYGGGSQVLVALSSLVGVPCYYGNGKAGPRDHISSIMAEGRVRGTDNSEQPCQGRKEKGTMYGGRDEKRGQETPLQNPRILPIVWLKPLDPQTNLRLMDNHSQSFLLNLCY